MLPAEGTPIAEANDRATEDVWSRLEQRKCKEELNRFRPLAGANFSAEVASIREEVRQLRALQESMDHEVKSLSDHQKTCHTKLSDLAGEHAAHRCEMASLIAECQAAQSKLQKSHAEVDMRNSALPGTIAEQLKLLEADLRRELAAFSVEQQASQARLEVLNPQQLRNDIAKLSRDSDVSTSKLSSGLRALESALRCEAEKLSHAVQASESKQSSSLQALGTELRSEIAQISDSLSTSAEASQSKASAMLKVSASELRSEVAKLAQDHQMSQARLASSEHGLRTEVAKLSEDLASLAKETSMLMSLEPEVKRVVANLLEGHQLSLNSTMTDLESKLTSALSQVRGDHEHQLSHLKNLMADLAGQIRGLEKETGSLRVDHNAEIRKVWTTVSSREEEIVHRFYGQHGAVSELLGTLEADLRRDMFSINTDQELQRAELCRAWQEIDQLRRRNRAHSSSPPRPGSDAAKSSSAAKPGKQKVSTDMLAQRHQAKFEDHILRLATPADDASERPCMTAPASPISARRTVETLDRPLATAHASPAALGRTLDPPERLCLTTSSMRRTLTPPARRVSLSPVRMSPVVSTLVSAVSKTPTRIY
eukprot:gnl/TRDRNA2_/TRDRNA2_40249_c0_seq1.p1 gnl/TRDRNA2_/TRDRNA2_40249_c0~~gnl/TRDRNA2_/TRDRNA2_40249_c0_seq1.p1  ORF type:complete len:597 (-),score=95.77 gnl/TRDRNA2_/TRDRNA2_40249_c0_seq1:63-1853(-)